MLHIGSLLDDGTERIQNDAGFQAREILFASHHLVRHGPVDVLASVFECDGEPIQSVAIDVRVDAVVPQSTSDRLDQCRRDASLGIAVDQYRI